MALSMISEPAPSASQRRLLHGALKDIHYAREKLKAVKLLQCYGEGQPALVAATEEISAHLQKLWLLIDGLDVKSELAQPSAS